MENDKLDEIFNDEKLNRSIRMVKRKTAIRTVIISIIVAFIVFITGGYANFRISLKMSEKLYNDKVAEVKLTVPNGYISKTADTLGFLGGKSNYQISRNIGGRSVVMSDSIVPFGLFPNYAVYHRYAGGGYHTTGQWPDSFWENGERKMVFFHPGIQYKEYRNDLGILDELSDDKIIEMGISFDKPFKIKDISGILPGMNISWYWIDAFTEGDKDEYVKAAREYDAKAAFIRENEVIGVSIMGSSSLVIGKFQDAYKEVLQLLQQSRWHKHQLIYNEIIQKGYDNPDSIPILGVIVSGTKEEVKKIIDNPHVKGASMGITIDKY